MMNLPAQRGYHGRLPFPAEIRNQIYRHVLTPKYLVWIVDKLSPPLRPAADLALLRVSKATSEEATSVLYTEGRFRIGVKVDKLERLSPIVPKMRLMNDISLNFSLHRGFYAGEAPPGIFEMIVSMCTGTDALRERIDITFDATCLTEWIQADLRTSKGDLETFGKFKGFRTVTLRLCWFDFCGNGENDGKYVHTRDLVRTILEPSLGKAIQGGCEEMMWLHFYPRSTSSLA